MQVKQTILLNDTVCINAEKVYDWVIEEYTGSRTLTVTDIIPDLPIDAVDVQVEAILSDADGNPLSLNSRIDVAEVAPREARQFEVNGEVVTLQRVTFRTRFNVMLRATAVLAGTPVQVTTPTPIAFEFLKTTYLCAPAGTTLVARVTDFSSLAVVNIDGDVIVDIDLNAFFCYNIQAVAPVTIELTATLCEPREQIAEECANPTIPQGCRVVFPGNDDDDNGNGNGNGNG